MTAPNRRTATIAALALAGALLTASPAAAKSPADRMVAWNDCRVVAEYGPFWGRVLLGGRNPDRYPPCGTHPGAKYVGSAFAK